MCERERCARVLRIFQARICAILDRQPTCATRASERAIARGAGHKMMRVRIAASRGGVGETKGVELAPAAAAIRVRGGLTAAELKARA